jgi:hypothetical protein
MFTSISLAHPCCSALACKCIHDTCQDFYGSRVWEANGMLISDVKVTVGGAFVPTVHRSGCTSNPGEIRSNMEHHLPGNDHWRLASGFI